MSWVAVGEQVLAASEHVKELQVGPTQQEQVSVRADAELAFLG